MPNKSTSTSVPRGDLLGSLMEAPSDVVYIASEIFPETPVPKKSGTFGVIPLAAMLTMPPSIERAPKAGYNRTDWDFEEGTYRCKEYGHEEPKDDSEAENYSDYFNYEVVLAERGNRIVDTKREQRVAALLHNTSTFALSGNTGKNLSIEWDNSASCTPIDDMQDGINGVRARCGMTPNLLQISFPAWRDLWQCSQVRNAIATVITKDVPDVTNEAARRALAGVLGIKKIAVGDAVVNSAKKGQAPVIGEIWSAEYAALVVANPSKDIAAPTAGRTFYWEADGGMKFVDDYRDERTRGDVVRVRQNVQEKFVYTECVYLFGNCRVP